MFDENVLKEVIARNGAVYQEIIAIEEMSELTKEITKNIRGSVNRDHIIEELADVYIMLRQLEMIHHIDSFELLEMIRKKTERLKERLNHESL